MLHYFMQVKCDQCEGWIHQMCGNLRNKVTDSFQYSCPECASSTDYAVMDTHICTNIILSLTLAS